MNTLYVFIGIHCFNSETDNKGYIPETTFSTNAFKLQDPNLIPCYINTIEERFEGKLNRETLKIEKAQSDFKYGDIAFADYGNTQYVFIVSDKMDLLEGYYSFITLDLRGTLNIGFRKSFFKKNLCKLRLATKEEKQKFFDALAKEGKAWDAEKRVIVDLRSKVKFKPFDKVVVRSTPNRPWTVDLFSYYYKELNNPYVCVSGMKCDCLPYNEETAKLIGTTKNVKK